MLVYFNRKKLRAVAFRVFLRHNSFPTVLNLKPFPAFEPDLCTLLRIRHDVFKCDEHPTCIQQLITDSSGRPPLFSIVIVVA